MTGGLAGLLCGILSGMGIGGGTLLMVWLTAVEGMPQENAQGINLLYFLPVAAVSLYFHRKNGLLKPKVILQSVLTGIPAAAGVAWFARNMDMGLLGKLFGGFLILVGIREIFYRERKAK